MIEFCIALGFCSFIAFFPLLVAWIADGLGDDDE